MHTQVCKTIRSSLRHDIRFVYRPHTLSSIVASVSSSCEELSPMVQHLRRIILRLPLFLSNQSVRCESRPRSLELTRQSAASKKKRVIMWDVVSRPAHTDTTLFSAVSCHPIEKGLRGLAHFGSLVVQHVSYSRIMCPGDA